MQKDKKEMHRRHQRCEKEKGLFCLFKRGKEDKYVGELLAMFMIHGTGV